jgi:sigma-B regulation protein RsbU (phosphoserine phosphatase)
MEPQIWSEHPRMMIVPGPVIEPLPHTHAMQCMEIWGGNTAFDSAVSMPGIDAWVFSQPHAGDEHGGDVHYISMCAGGKIARFAVADIAGHGASAGGLANELRKLMRKHINTVNQARFVRSLNRHMVSNADDGRFATALLATYFAPKDRLILCNAGHPPPLLYRAASHQWMILNEDLDERLASAGNLPLGIIQPTNYEQFAIALQPGDVVLMYTDSLIEASNAMGRQLGSQGLLELVRTLNIADPSSIARCLLQAIAGYRQGPADDDVTLVVMHHHAQGRPRFGPIERARTIGRMIGLLNV